LGKKLFFVIFLLLESAFKTRFIHFKRINEPVLICWPRLCFRVWLHGVQWHLVVQLHRSRDKLGPTRPFCSALPPTTADYVWGSVKTKPCTRHMTPEGRVKWFHISRSSLMDEWKSNIAYISITFTCT